MYSESDKYKALNQLALKNQEGTVQIGQDVRTVPAIALGDHEP